MNPSQIYRSREGEVIRISLKKALKKSRKSRAEIAAEISVPLGYRVTERMLNNYLADSREDFRLPAELIVPICAAISDYDLLSELVVRAGYRMITPEETKLLEIGKAYQSKLRAEIVLQGVEI